MTSEAFTTTIDPEVAGRAALPPVPDAGLVLVRVPKESGDVCAWHLLEFARRWRDEGRRVHLCDACVDGPVLHHAADVENAEGVTDAVLYGSSLSRITARLEKGVVLTTAGTVVGDPVRVLDHPRWSSITTAARDAGALMVVAVPSAADAARLESLADALVRFAPGERSEPVELEGASTDADRPSVPSAAAADAESDLDSDGAVEQSGGVTDRTDVPPAPANRDVRTSGGRVADETSRSRGLLIFVLLLVAILALLGAGYFGYVELPGITPVDVDPTIDVALLR